jgi:uncharacterized UBP type Zn finger protein
MQADPFNPVPTVALSDLLAALMSGADVPGNPCRGCGKNLFHQSHLFSHFPRVLIIEIDRLANTRYGSGPLANPLSFPEVLDMSGYSEEDQQSVGAITYQLKAVVGHYAWTASNGERKGHFKAFIRIDSSTYCFDDEDISKSDWSDCGAVCLLIYER